VTNCPPSKFVDPRGDNIYRDGCVGAIDAHHGSDLPAFLRSLPRIRASDVSWLLPSHCRKGVQTHPATAAAK
jgi:hypothetical protein